MNIKTIAEQVLTGMEELSVFIAQSNKRSESVSAWSIWQQLEHLFKVNKRISKRVCDGDKPTDKSPTFLGKFVLFTGFMKRGVGKSPEIVLPTGANQEELKVLYNEARELVASIPNKTDEILADKKFYPHHLFGGFTRFQWLKFMLIHQRHHLKIIKNIVKT